MKTAIFMFLVLLLLACGGASRLTPTDPDKYQEEREEYEKEQREKREKDSGE